MRTKIVSFGASLLLRLLVLTWRVRVLGPEPRRNGSPLVFCFRHGRQAGLFAYPRTRKTAVLCSLSKDGNLQAGILARLGFVVARGSSSNRGAAGLKEILRCVRRGEDAAFAVDGPRGPANRVKPGAILTAIQAKIPMVPITCHASRAWTFKKSWDQYQLPKPFSTLSIRRGNLIVPDSADTEHLRREMELVLSMLDKPFDTA